MSDDVNRLSELLARDPSNIAFLSLGEILRVRGDLESALRVAHRGLERHPLNAEAHALLARICIDRGELQRAFDEWDMALRLTPGGHTGALKGLGFISYRWGRLDDAERYLDAALAAAPDDASISRALESVRAARAALQRFGGEQQVQSAAPQVQAASSPEAAAPATATNGAAALPSFLEDAPVPAPPVVQESSARDLFRQALAAPELQAILIDADGLVVAGELLTPDGSDRSQDVGAGLSGVSDEANRAMRHLDLGEWKSITFEAGNAIAALSPLVDDALVVVAAPRNTPLGLLRRALERVQRRSDAWLREGT